MQYGADKTIHIADRQTDSNVTDLRHTGISQHPAEVVLGQRHDRTDQHAADAKNA